MQMRMTRTVKMPTPTPIASRVLGFFGALEGELVSAIVVTGLVVLLVCAGPTEGVE